MANAIFDNVNLPPSAPGGGVTRRVKVWNGVAWVLRPVKTYNSGTGTWVEREVKKL